MHAVLIARILFVLCGVSFGYLALALGGPSSRTAPGIAVLLLAFAMLLLVVLPSTTPLPLIRTVAIVLAISIITADVTVLGDLGDHEIPAAERNDIVSWAAAQLLSTEGSALTLRLSLEAGARP